MLDAKVDREPAAVVVVAAALVEMEEAFEVVAGLVVVVTLVEVALVEVAFVEDAFVEVVLLVLLEEDLVARA